MVPINHQNPQVLSNFRKPKCLKKTLQILLSISLCSFLFSYSSFLSTSFSSLHISISEFISHLFNYYINRPLMFLLCNGILVFVTGFAGLIGPSTSSTTADDHQVEFYTQNRDCRRSEPANVEMKVCVRDEEEMQENAGALVLVVAKEEGRGGENEEDCCQTNDNCEILSLETGESDQRFENFIKETKERMRIESQQRMRIESRQLVLLV